MNSEVQNNSNEAGKSRTTFSLIAGLIVVLILVSVVAYRAGIDPKQIKADVANFAQKISERYAKRGMEVKLEYSDIAVQGGIFEKSIALKDASITVKGKNVNYKLLAPTAKIVPIDSNFDELTIELASPLKLLKNGEATEISYVMPTPLKINVMLNEGGQREYVMPLPVAAELEVKEGELLKKYSVANNESSFVSGAFSEGLEDPYSMAVAIEELKIAGEGIEANISSASLGSASQEGAGEFEMEISGLSSNVLPASLGAIDVNLLQKSKLNVETKENDIDVEVFSVSGDGFDLNLKGRIGMRESELMPIVNLNVAANGVSKVFAALSETKYFAQKQKNITIQAIKMIAPDWNEFSLSPLQFDVLRDENAPFVIGKVKADELVAMILQQYLQMQEIAPAPEVVPTPETKKTPAESSVEQIQPQAPIAQ